MAKRKRIVDVLKATKKKKNPIHKIVDATGYEIGDEIKITMPTDFKTSINETLPEGRILKAVDRFEDAIENAIKRINAMI